MRFLHLIARRLQFILGDKPVQHSLGEDSYGERSALPVIAEDAWRGFGWPCTPADFRGVPTPLVPRIHEERSKL